VNLLAASLAAHRFGMGARPGEIASMADAPRRHLLAQLERPDGALVPEDGAFASSLPQMRRLVEIEGIDDRLQRRDARRAQRQEAMADLAVETERRMWRAVGSPTPFLERLVWFWSNHFAVSLSARATAPFLASFEREAIRPHVLGRFEDMLLAAERHPAMLIYLDNHRSVGPQSELGLAGDKGLNENLAREILELHTLGVQGGYGQADVESLARIITGWSIPVIPNTALAPPSASFHFSRAAHQPGSKVLLGRRYAEAGEEEGRAALRELARHPATASHLAIKFARHFVADEPPPDLVAALEESFLKTGGDLRSLAATLVRHRSAWSTTGRKLRTPIQMVAATSRAVALEESADGRLAIALDGLNQNPFRAPSPAGYDDSAGAWAGPEAVVLRVEWCAEVAARSPLRLPPDILAADILGAMASKATLEACANASNRTLGYALALASPDFQWR